MSVRTFLIADVRGYTRYTHEHGDEQAGSLAALFAALTREVVTAHGGELLELRGDEALSVFASARQAVRAAIELQRRFRSRDEAGAPVLPLGVGISLDAGEAVPIEGGYRGAALNRASRLCSIARPGEILASDTVASLAGHLEGAGYVPRRPSRLKGLPEPVRHVEVVPDVALPPLPPPPIAEPTPRTGPSALRLRRKWVLALLGSALALAAVLALLVVTRTGDENGAGTPTPVVPDSVAVIDPQTNSVRADVPVGGDPGPVAVGGQAIWVGNQEDETVSRIDPASRTVVRTFGVGHPVNGLAFAEGSLWIASSREGVLHRFDPSSGSSLGTIRFRPPHALHNWNSGGLNTDRPVAMVFGEGGLWLGDRDSQTLLRIDAQSLRVTARIHDLDPKALALRAGSVWVISYLDQAVVRVDAETGVPSAPIPVPVNPNGIVAGARSIWVAHDREGTVSEIDPPSASVLRTFDRGAAGFPAAVSGYNTGMAASNGFIWIANGFDHTISRINEVTREKSILDVGGRPASLLASGGFIWATISSRHYQG